jgi:hypothetical protein
MIPGTSGRAIFPVVAGKEVDKTAMVNNIVE